MPISLTPMERFGLLALNGGPAPMIDIVNTLVFKAVCTALKLDLFEQLAGGPMTADEITDKTATDKAALPLFLRVLTGGGYLRFRAGKYSNSRMTTRWLTSASPDDMSALFPFFDDTCHRWDYLDQTVRAGTPPMTADTWMDEHHGGWDNYHRGLLSIANMFADQVVAAVPLPASARSLVDLGGSHGLYAARFLQRYPDLVARVIDWEEARELCRKTIQRLGLTDRMSFVEGDILKDNIEGEHDVVLLFNLIRIFQEDTVRDLLANARRCLASGGTVVVFDHLGTSEPSSFLQTNADAVRLELLNSTTGTTYPFDKVCAFLRETGFKDVRPTKLRRAPGLGLAVARK